MSGGREKAINEFDDLAVATGLVIKPPELAKAASSRGKRRKVENGLCYSELERGKEIGGRRREKEKIYADASGVNDRPSWKTP